MYNDAYIKLFHIKAISNTDQNVNQHILIDDRFGPQSIYIFYFGYVFDETDVVTFQCSVIYYEGSKQKYFNTNSL